MFKLGCYGSGNRTKALLDSLNQDGFYKVHAVYDLNIESAEDFAAQYGGTVCKTPEELINTDGIDAFFISLSPFAHAEALRRTIPCGKPIFVEKPVSFSAAEIKELVLLAEKYNTPVQVGFMRRFLPENRAALDFIKENDPGRIFSVDCNWFHHGEEEMNYNLYHHPDNFRLHVSQIPFHCCHMLDILLLMGGNAEKVTSLTTKVVDRPYPSPDDLICNIQFTSGFNGRFHYSSMVYYNEMSYRFHAENYSLKIDAGGGDMFVIHRRPRFKTSRIGSHPELHKASPDFNLTYNQFCAPQKVNFSQWLDWANENIMYEFVQLVRDGKMPESDLRTALRVQGLAEAIEASGKLQKTIELDDEGLPIGIE
ncbi:MAG: Gfo/Idh/MocA family oxidoreductase [Lentisphaeria bacterium]|nr:Gfo/Idh/MocA family oxidoreductase [Lentisphaeria bacterium]